MLVINFILFYYFIQMNFIYIYTKLYAITKVYF